MPSTPSWIAVSAISALSLGVIASGAIGVAQAMPLVDSTTTAEVPPISTVPDDGKGGTGSDGVIIPTPSPTGSPVLSSAPGVDPTTIPAPQPVAPRPAATPTDSVPSPMSVDDETSGSNSGSSSGSSSSSGGSDSDSDSDD
ncbi:MAG: hypothetical protein C0444_02490 [Microbacterium sp.]|nr:hypothetical protein [Microbacterium sp.]MBA4345394.1 hypothetical protein [Microbacterium sp.]